jgi:hypothetical protein
MIALGDQRFAGALCLISEGGCDPGLGRDLDFAC